MRAYVELIRIDLRLAFRDKMVIFFNYLFPLIFFFTFAELLGADQGGTITYVVSMVLVLGILGNGLFGAGMRAVQEREANILRRFKVAPISPTPILTASIVTGWAIYLPAVLITLSLAHFLYGMPFPRRWLELLALITLGLCAFRSIGLILASVANSMQESNILIQLFYMPMLFLSGATFPLTLLPGWAQIVSQFLPASYLVTGFQGIFIREESFLENWPAACALVVTMGIALFISRQLFRWEKQEKIRPIAKAWVLAVMLPFLIMGSHQAFSGDQIQKAKVLWRDIQRSESLLIRGARLFLGDGTVIESGSILIREGKIAEVFPGEAPDAETLQAELIEGAGKTVLPGLIDVHVHLGMPGGLLENYSDFDVEAGMRRAAAAYLYSGVTTVRSAGDFLSSALKVRGELSSGRLLGAELFVSSPIFTAEDGHGTEYFEQAPEYFRGRIERQFLRLPASSQEARRDVEELKDQGVDAFKAVLDSGTSRRLFSRLDLSILRVVIEAAHQQGVPVSVHTGDARDVADAVLLGADSIEHGSFREAVPAEVFQRMREAGTIYVPTLTVGEAFRDLSTGARRLLNRSLVQQTAPAEMIRFTLRAIESGQLRRRFEGRAGSLQIGKRNLLEAYKSGAILAAGSDAGNLLVPHGPTVQRELQLWVEAGVPPGAALRAATFDAARLLGQESRIGRIQKGFDADLLIVDGNPLENIAAAERISALIFKGEPIRRSRLFTQDFGAP